MTSVVFYFQVHQPHRLRRYTVFDTDPFYFDTGKNGAICGKVAQKCYRPATALLLELVRRHEGRFRVAFSITGTVLDQLAEFAPDVIDLFQQLGATGACEFLGETYHHALSFLYSRDEFAQNVEMHTRKIQSLFGQTPRVFRNTELIYNNDLAHALAAMTDADGSPRWKGVLCEGVDRVLGYRSPNYLYTPPAGSGHGALPALLLKNYRLSDDIAFRFSNRGWPEWPLTVEKFARWVDAINGDGHVCNLFMDYETFGEHQWADTGIFAFLEALPRAILGTKPGHNGFLTPGEAIDRYAPVGVYDVPDAVSWADSERDLSAWRGNAMQSAALDEIFRLERPIKAALAAAERSGDAAERDEAMYLLDDWRKLTTSDHFYYMSTKFWSDGDVHKYFSPYESPYDAYINYMNVLDNVRSRIARRPAAV